MRGVAGRRATRSGRHLTLQRRLSSVGGLSCAHSGKKGSSRCLRKMIAYDLNSPGQNYDDLIEDIKSLGPWWHHLDCTWLVKTTTAATELRTA